jgi:hypothetical protein
MFLIIDSECTNTVDPHKVIIISLFFSCIFIFSSQMDVYFLYSILVLTF